MFHTFEAAKFTEGVEAQDDESQAKDRKFPLLRRTATVRACENCRKRKIRCDGGRPCEACRWYRKANACCYTEPRQRQMPNRKSMEQMSSTVRDYRNILQQLFPSTQPESLVNLPREKLLEIINKSASIQPPSPALSSGSVVEANAISPNAEAGGLETLQTMPEETAENAEHLETSGITDEVNALSLSVKHPSSYQGISSVMAVLRVILWIYPESQTVFSASPDQTTIPSRAQTPVPKESTPTKLDQTSLLDSYFDFVHPLMPLIEEQSFRETYRNGMRHDDRWLALLNMVFAMGSVAATDADDKNHITYFELAKRHLGGLECIGSAHLETVQTLAIMGGLYLHYLQSPNMANSTMGACLRMALALGLHREYVNARPKNNMGDPAWSTDMRRRVWWSIYVLDAWANMPLGRPSMRDSAAITADLPLLANDRGQGEAVFFLSQNIKFAKITTQIENALAITPLVSNSEMCALDAALVEWFTHFSGALQSTPTMATSEGNLSTRTIMRWRYQLSRIILHRPVLLNYAVRRIPFSQLRQEERDAIGKCRDIAGELISDIATTCRPNQICGWNGLWFIYNAVLVPLLSLFSDPHDPENVGSSRSSIELALQTMNEIMHHSPTGKRSVEVTHRIYEASKRLIADTRSIIERNAAASKRAKNTSSNSSRRHLTVQKLKDARPPLPSPSPSVAATLVSPQTQGHPSSACSSTGNFFTDFQQQSPDSTGSFQAYNPTNLPTDSNAFDLDIQTMWDSLNWTTGCESSDLPFESYPLSGFVGWPEDVDNMFHPPPSFETNLANIRSETATNVVVPVNGLNVVSTGFWGGQVGGTTMTPAEESELAAGPKQNRHDSGGPQHSQYHHQ